MVVDRFVRVLNASRDRLARLISRTGISPNALTLAGVLLSVGVAALFAQGKCRWGGALMLFSNACDALDGAVARAGNMKTKLGTFLDSSLDRYSDALALAGIIIYYTCQGDVLLVTAGVSALVGSMLVSYTRARAETLIGSCSVGFWTRGERCLLLMIAALLNRLPAAVWILAVLTHVTVLQRILHTHWMLKRGHPMFHPPRSEPSLFVPGPDPTSTGLRKVARAIARFVLWDYQRGSLAYDVAVAVILALVILLPVR